MIITLKGCTATAFIGGLNFFKVSKGTVSGADVTISTSTINKDAATSTSARDIATVALKSNYENLVVTVTMGGATVNWFANGKVTIPANTAVTGDIKISASATAIQVTPPSSGDDTGEDTGVYPIGQVLDSGTVSIAATSISPSCTTKGILECGGSYEITITTDYSGECSIYLAGASSGSQYVLKKQTGVVANTPFTLTFDVPYIKYSGTQQVALDRVWFRSHQSTQCTFTYSIKKTGYDNNPLEGVATFNDTTVSAQGQRVYGFEAGCTYDYEITPSYTGQMTIYQAYSTVGGSPGSVENIGALSITSVTANTPITGTITILETPSVTEATKGRLPDTLILRSHQSVGVSIQYKFTKK